ncbi:galactan 1,3-beta-galactosidase [Infundibulicybe gibba]|nr:galactan 1,3-beta-galactosidase [Infundibulicybe gibba]
MTLGMKLTSLLAFASLAVTVNAAVIVPGATWTDTSGNVIQAHGGGFLKVGSTFYWHGEDKSHNSALFKAVSCYSSTDLVTWARQNDALTPIAGTMISTSNIVERPKANSEYVMWFHSDTSNYGAAEAGVATAKTPCGPFTYKSSVLPLGAQSRDMGLFQDAAQTTYLLYASDNNQNFKISKLASNYYTVASQTSVLSGSTLEAPGIIKRNGVHLYLFASHTSGWDQTPTNSLLLLWANHLMGCSRSDVPQSLSGPWSAQADIAPEPVRTYFSQNNFDMLINSNFGVYMGDRWRPSLLGSSRYMWFPLSWATGVPQLFLPIGTATIASDGSFSGGKAVGFLGHGGSITINNVQGTGQAQWVSLYYANADATWRNTTVSVNGGPSVLVDQPNTGGVHVILSVPVKLTLRSGANSITLGAGQTNYAADLDKIVVYTAT